MPASHARRATIPRWRKLGFGLTVVAALCVTLELALAAIGIDPSDRFFDPLVGFDGGTPTYVESRDGARGQLQTSPAKLDYFNRQRFDRVKPSGTKRVFCLGGSTTYGRPYADATSFVGWLRTFLLAGGTGQTWEVINAGGISYGSERVLRVMREVVEYEPDLFVVYTGHNEYLERHSHDQLLSQPRGLRTAVAYAHRTRCATVARYGMHQLFGPSRAKPTLDMEVDPILDHPRGLSSYRREILRRDEATVAFARHLKSMIDVARSANAGLLFVSPVSNLRDCAPFRSQHTRGLSDADYVAWQVAVSEGKQFRRRQEWRSAGEAFGRAAAINPQHAETHFQHAEVLLHNGQSDLAFAAFVRARDEDVCPLRATTQTLAALRDVAGRRGVCLVNCRDELAKICQLENGHEVFGRESFWDHVHPRIEVHRRLALQILNAMIRSEWAESAAYPTESAIRLATERQMGRLNERSHAEAERNVARILWWAGKRDEAGRHALRAAAAMPQDRDSLIVSAAYLRYLGRERESLDYFSRALDCSEMDPAAYHFAAVRWMKLGEYQRAGRYISAAMAARPDDAELVCVAADIRMAAGHPAEAVDRYEAALRLSPGYRPAKAGLAMALAAVSCDTMTHEPRNTVPQGSTQ